jgi:adenosylhomocysteine nucleosidase
MKVLVTFAVDAEFAPWRKLRKFRFIDYQGLRLWRSDAEEIEITTLVTGIGREAAAQAMDLMMRMADGDQYFDVCVSSGLAGALDESLRATEIVAPNRLVVEQRYADLPTDQLGVDIELRRLAIELGAKDMDCLFTSEKVVVKATQKKICGAKGQLVDMESFEIIKEACAWGARCVVIRAISDSATEDLPLNFNLTLSGEKQVSIVKVVVELAKNPFVLSSLLRFAKRSRRAAEELGNFLERYVSGLTAVSSVGRSDGVRAR